MPEATPPPRLQEADLDTQELKMLQDALPEAYALAQVNQTFHQYETYRSNNHDRRWQNADGLFTAWVPPKVWEGTNVPRASLGVPLTFYHIQTMLPTLISSVFANGNDDWFQAEAPEGVDPQAARSQKAVLRYAIEESGIENGNTGRSEISLALHNLLQYGNGFLHLELDPEDQLPVPEWIDIRDVYIDPECQTPNIDDCRSVIVRKNVPIETLEDLSQKRPELRIPSRKVLTYLSQNSPIAIADVTKHITEAVRGVLYNPTASRLSPIPSQKTVEILIYYTRHRIIWVLNRCWVALNIPNPWDFIPVCSAPCYIYAGRFYAMSVPDIQEGYQRYIEDLLGKRLDHLSLSVNPPRVYKRGAYMTPAQSRWFPSATYGLNESDDMATLAPQGSTDDIYRDIGYIEMLSEKADGVNALSQGTPRPGNINRTLGGVQAQMQGSLGRISYLIENIETYMIIPMLYKMQRMIKVLSAPGQTLPGLTGGQTRTQSRVPAAHFNEKAKFRMLASSQVRTRQEIGQMFPFLTQYLLSGPFMAQLAQTGKTVDFEELIQMLQDATGVGRMYRLIRPMNEQEQQAMQQPSPEQQAEQQKAQMDAQVRLQMGQMNLQGRREEVQGNLQAEMIKKQPDQPNPMEQQQKLMDMAMQQQMQKMKLTAQQQKMVMDAMQAQQKLQLERELAAQKIEAQRAQHMMDLQMGAMDMHQSAVSSQLDMQMQAQQAQMQQAQMMNQNQMELAHTQAKNKIEQENMRSAGMKKTAAKSREKKGE